MSWAVGDNSAGRDIGYGVPSICDHPDCNTLIDRGLSYVCGDMHDGGEDGCGLYFCRDHLTYTGGYVTTRDEGCSYTTDSTLCERCHQGEAPFTPTPDTPEWIHHKLKDPSWERWRSQNPEKVQELTQAFQSNLNPNV